MENQKLTLNGMRLDAELKNVPIGFVNALRRILLAEIPRVVLTNVQILDNTTRLPHEMLRLRTELLPVNVRPEEAAVIRDTRLELRFEPSKEPREVTSDDFKVVAGPRGDVLLKDRDLGTDLFFLNLQPNESVHIRASLGVEPRGSSHVCVSTFKNHVDPERMKEDRETYITAAVNRYPPDTLSEKEIGQITADAIKEFDNFHYQRSYARDENGRPYWFDFAVESVGALPAKDLVRRAAEVLKGKVAEWVKTPIQREEGGWYRMETEGETFTLGQLMQEIIYKGGVADFVSRDCGHPLTPKLVIRFSTKAQPETVVEDAQRTAVALCESILGSV
jgi:DNA-directed RNA polymerase subunit L